MFVVMTVVEMMVIMMLVMMLDKVRTPGSDLKIQGFATWKLHVRTRNLHVRNHMRTCNLQVRVGPLRSRMIAIWFDTDRRCNSPAARGNTFGWPLHVFRP